MKRQLNVNWFEKYFFHGLENKEEIVKRIILNGAKDLAITKELDVENQRTGYEKDREVLLRLIVQLERFTSLHDDIENRRYFYDEIDIDSEQIQEIYNQNINKLEQRWAISVVNYRPVSGIFFNTYGYSDEIRQKHGKCSGAQLLEELNQQSSWTSEVYDVLCYLSELEQENKFEYYSLFLDSKYARAIDRNKKGITDDKEIHEIRNVYRKYLKARQVSGVDIKLAIRAPQMNEEMKAYIEEHYPEYDTITTLKTDAMNVQYDKRLDKEIKKVYDMFLIKEGQGIEI